MTSLAQPSVSPESGNGLRIGLQRALKGWKMHASWLCIFIIVPTAFAIKYKLAFNMTPSLKFNVAIIEKGLYPKARNDLIAYRWPGGVGIPAGLEMVKRVAGVMGDQVELVALPSDGTTHQASRVYLHEVVVRDAQGMPYARVKAKQFTRDGKPIAPIQSTSIRRGEYFVVADHPDSLDSRYAVTGLIHADQVIGTVVWSW